MLSNSKRNVLGILIDATDYETACDKILSAAQQKRNLTVTALAVHGLMTGALDREHQFRLNHFDLLLPDGQPVRWALNLFHGARLSDRVYGPNLTLKVCAQAAEKGVPLYFYGTKPETLCLRCDNFSKRDFPESWIAGMEPSRNSDASTPTEKEDLAERIVALLAPASSSSDWAARARKHSRSNSGNSCRCQSSRWARHFHFLLDSYRRLRHGCSAPGSNGYSGSRSNQSACGAAIFFSTQLICACLAYRH